VVAAVIAILIAVLFLYLGYSWFSGFTELEAKGNDFAGLLAIFGLGAWTIAAAFGITGIILLTRKS